jgi:hypothetical protein
MLTSLFSWLQLNQSSSSASSLPLWVAIAREGRAQQRRQHQQHPGTYRYLSSGGLRVGEHFKIPRNDHNDVMTILRQVGPLVNLFKRRGYDPKRIDAVVDYAIQKDCLQITLTNLDILNAYGEKLERGGSLKMINFSFSKAERGWGVNFSIGSIHYRRY